MPEAAELNIDEAANSIAADMGLGGERDSTDLDDKIDGAAADAGAGSDKGAQDDKPAAASTDKAAAANGEDAELPVPQSWKKEMHEHWGKMPKPVQTYYIEREKQMLDGLGQYKTDAEYGRSLKQVLAKHEDVLRSQGLQPQQAVDFLFNAHRRLSSGTPEQRQAYLVGEVAKAYGISIPQAAAAVADATGAQPASQSPEVKALMERQERIEAALAQEQTQRYEQARAKAASEVEAFAKDEKNAYFDEVAEDIALLVKTGLSLPQAYEKAVWANPVTRQKEISRIQQETEKANAEKVKEAAKAAKKATSTNVKGRDTTRTPTEGRATVGNMDEVLSETLSDIKSRH